jgi:hypothetical protein
VHVSVIVPENAPWEPSASSSIYVTTQNRNKKGGSEASLVTDISIFQLLRLFAKKRRDLKLLLVL